MGLRGIVRRSVVRVVLIALTVSSISMVSGAVLAATVQDYIAQADELHRGRTDASKVEAEVKVLEEGLAAFPESYDILWRLARAYEFLGGAAAKENKLPLFEKAKGYAERATKANPDGLDGWYWYGLTIGRWGETRGILQSLSMAGPMRDALEKALKIDPNHAPSYHVLGCLYRELPGVVSFGNINKAIEYFEKAVSLNPNDIGLRLDTAKAYIKKKNYPKAREHLNHLLTLPNNPEFPASDEAAKEEARKLLASIEGK
ncbi:MAG: tetratricopeptide repeat protein [Bacillota bacterium]